LCSTDEGLPTLPCRRDRCRCDLRVRAGNARSVPDDPLPVAPVDAGSQDPQKVIDHLLANPPVVHIVDTPEGKRPGVWSTDESCYRFIASVITSETRSLETGSGLSTAVFAALGAQHVCVTPAREEADLLRAYFDQQAISGEHVRFVVESSHLALPRLNGPIDFVLIDGAHGYPIPIIDWFYAGSLLGKNGIVVLDDTPLPAVAALVDFLRHDPRWLQTAGGARWLAFRRLSEGSLLEGQWDQPFLRTPRSRDLALELTHRVQRRLGAQLRRSMAAISSK
jgi:hypothetical protein